jgi:hypothetical protein
MLSDEDHVAEGRYSGGESRFNEENHAKLAI